MINILIVDDDIATVEVIRDSLDWERLGISQVYTAYNVASAKKILKKHPVDIIISDIEMPQASGLDLLKWVRQERYNSEFLLLTCHENFLYATDAIQYDAAAYLTKPFDLPIMELNIQKIINKLEQKRNLQKNSDYGKLMEKNIRYVKLEFWKQLLNGDFQSEDMIFQEITSRHLDIDVNGLYSLVYMKISNNESDLERYGKSVYEYHLEKTITEIITGSHENDSVVKLHTDNGLSFITIIKNIEREDIKDRCDRLIDACKEPFSSVITCCISDSNTLSELADSKEELDKLFYYYININNRVFFQDEVETLDISEIQILDMDKMSKYIKEKNKSRILNYLKQTFQELTTIKRMHLYSLYLIKHEIMQVVYADLMEKGIQASKLFNDEFSIDMSNRSLEGTTDMIRWVNYFLEKTFSYQDEVEKSATIIDKINQFIHSHYNKDISRNEIAEEFFLTPDYLAKLYKSKTGVTIKGYINEYRINKAKDLLNTSDINISEIAIAVGFDNLSYFSTIFKKAVGLSPSEYRGEKSIL